VEYLTLAEQINKAFDVLRTKATDTIVRFNITEIDTIATDLSFITSPSEISLPNDINAAIDITDVIFSVLG